LIVVHDGKKEGVQIAAVFPGDFNPDRFRYFEIDRFHCDTKPKNHGILQAKGEYIAFLDSDNVWRPDHLAVLVPELEKSPEVVLVYGDRMRYVDDKLAGIGSFHDFDPFLLASKNYIDTSDVLIRKSVLMEVGGFDERYKKYVDWNLWLRLVKAGYNFKRIPVILTDYYLSKDSKSLQPLDELAPLTPAWDPMELEIRLPYLGPVKPARVAIFSLTMNRLEYTKKCFESLYKTAGYEFDHFIIDNGSKDGTAEWIKQNQVGFFLGENEENHGISKASNQALETIFNHGSYDIIVKVDNDCLFQTDGWLKQMVAIWEKNHRIALSPYVNGLRDNPGGAPRLHYGQLDNTLLGLTNHLGGICVFADARAYKDWRWDEGDFLHGNQDLEFSQHLKQVGFQLGYLESHFVEHYEGTEGQEKRYPEYFKRRREVEKRTRYEENS